MSRLGFHDRLALVVVLAGLPAVGVALVLLFRTEPGTLWFWIVGAGIVAPLVSGAVALRSRLVFRLRTATNLVTALREGDMSFRARGEKRDQGWGGLVVELNELAEAIREQRLDEMEATALLRMVLGEIDVAVYAFDDAGRLRLVNEAGERLLGLGAASAEGRTAEELGLGECLDGEPERTLLLDLPGGGGRWELRRGRYRHLGRPRRLLVLSNVSRALRAEELEAWKRLIRVMGHELNNSLAPIRSLAGSLDRLVTREPAPDGWREDLRDGLRVIGSRSEALNRFLGAYASLAKLPEPRPSRVEVGALVRRVAELERRLVVSVDPGPELAIQADRDQLEQLLINLVRNAVDASLETGGGVVMSWQVEARRLTLTVRDDGPGLASPANLFVPFYTTKPEGTGIGLVLCRQIAEAHGGNLTLENRADGPGCVVWLVLPSVTTRTT